MVKKLRKIKPNTDALVQGSYYFIDKNKNWNEKSLLKDEYVSIFSFNKDGRSHGITIVI